MTKEEINEILTSYKWIKVKRYKMDETKSWEERYKELDTHHIEETSFLIDSIRKILKEQNDEKI